MTERNEVSEWLNAGKSRSFVRIGKGKSAHLGTGNDETLCGRLMMDGSAYISASDVADMAGACASCWKIMLKDSGENMPSKKTTPTAPAATEEIDTTLADVLDETPAADPNAVKLEQIVANTERAASLLEAENAEGLAELEKETEGIISSLPSRGRHGKDSWAKVKSDLRAQFREIAHPATAPETPKAAKAKAVEVKAKAEAEAADYAKFEGVKDRVNAGVGLVADGAKLIVAQAQTARQAAEMLLDAQRRITTENGVPDLLCKTPPALAARKDMYDGARKILTAESGEAEHSDSLVKKFGTAVRNQMSDVLRGYIRSLDSESGREEYAQFFGKVAEIHPELAPSEAIFTFYDIPKLSKRELINAKNAEKREAIAALEAKAEDGDNEAAEAVEELKAETVQERIIGNVQSAETAIKAAIKAAGSLSEDDRKALKARIAELAMLAAEL